MPAQVRTLLAANFYCLSTFLACFLFMVDFLSFVMNFIFIHAIFFKISDGSAQANYHSCNGQSSAQKTNLNRMPFDIGRRYVAELHNHIFLPDYLLI